MKATQSLPSPGKFPLQWRHTENLTNRMWERQHKLSGGMGSPAESGGLNGACRQEEEEQGLGAGRCCTLSSSRRSGIAAQIALSLYRPC